MHEGSKSSGPRRLCRMRRFGKNDRTTVKFARDKKMERDAEIRS